MTETGNSMAGLSFTRWIAALSAATRNVRVKIMMRSPKPDGIRRNVYLSCAITRSGLGASRLRQKLGRGQRRERPQELKALPKATKWKARRYPDSKRIGGTLYGLVPRVIYRCRRHGGAVCVT
jgi:hypothetical protein